MSAETPAKAEGDSVSAAIRSGKEDGLVIATIPKNATESYVLEVGLWKKRPTVSARLWYTDKATGELKPGREGFSASPANAVKIRDAFDEIVKECERRGWLADDTSRERAA
jgi:hypothetical protein